MTEGLAMTAEITVLDSEIESGGVRSAPRRVVEADSTLHGGEVDSLLKVLTTVVVRR